MYNPEQQLALIEQAVRHRTDTHQRDWMIAFHDGVVVCVPRSFRTNEYFILLSCTRSDLMLGFTVEMWEEIKAQFLEYSKLETK